MLIQPHHVAVFEAAQWRRFEDEVIARLRESFGTAVGQRYKNEEDLRLMIRDGVNGGRPFGILGESAITRLVAYEFEYGAGFKSLSWVRPVLIAPNIDGDDKMDRLDAVRVFEVR